MIGILCGFFMLTLTTVPLKICKAQENETRNRVASRRVFDGEYFIKEFCEYARNIQLLPDVEKRIKEVREFLLACEKNNCDINGIILCQLLFEEHRPKVGVPSWMGTKKINIRIAEPIVFVDKIPVLAVFGYSFSGAPQSSTQFFDQCVKFRSWRRQVDIPTQSEISKGIDRYLQLSNLDLSLIHI